MGHLQWVNKFSIEFRDEQTLACTREDNGLHFIVARHGREVMGT